MKEGIAFKIPLQGTHDDAYGKAVEAEVVLKKNEGVKTSPVQVENGFIQGRTLEELLKSASRNIKPRNIEEGDVVAERKLAVKNEDIPETKEDGLEKVEAAAEKKENTQEEQEKITRYQNEVLRVTNAVKSELEKKTEPAGLLAVLHKEVHELWRRKDADLLNLEGKELEERIKAEMLEAVAAHHHGASQKELLAICRQVFGVISGGAHTPEEKVALEKTAENVQESQERKEQEAEIEKLFGDIFDWKRSGYGEMEFKVANKKNKQTVAHALELARFKPGTGAMAELVKAFLGKVMEEKLEISAENFREFCLQNIDGLKATKSENVKMAMKMACGFKEDVEQRQEIANEEFEKVDLDINKMVAAYEDKIRNGKANKLHGEKSEEIAAKQSGLLVEAINGYSGLLDRYENGERTEDLFDGYKKHQADIAKLRDKLFGEWSAELKKNEKLKQEKNLFKEFVRRIDHGKEWRMKEIKSGKEVVPDFEYRNFHAKGLSGDDVVRLKEYFAQAKTELEEAMAKQKELKITKKENPKLKEHIKTTSDNLLHQLKQYLGILREAKNSDLYTVAGEEFIEKHLAIWNDIANKADKTHQNFNAGKVNNVTLKQFETYGHEIQDAIEEFERNKLAYQKTAVDAESEPSAAEAGEIVENDTERMEDHGDAEDKLVSVPYGGFENAQKAETERGETDFDWSANHEEPVDNHAPMEQALELSEAEKQAMEELLLDAPHVAQFLIAEYEKKGVFAEHMDDMAFKLSYVRPRVQLVATRLLKNNYGLADEKAKAVAKEIAGRFKL